MSTPLADPADVIAQMQPGMAIYGRTFRPGQNTDFFVREESPIIKRLHNPTVVIRPGAFYRSDIGLVVVMFQIGPHTDQLFETWFNYYATNEDGKRAMETIIEQDTIAFHFYGETAQKEKSVAIQNNLKEFFRDACEGMAKLQPWTMAAFDRAREDLYTDYPNPMKLWHALGKVGVNG